jgi:hypothetical protein
MLFLAWETRGVVQRKRSPSNELEDELQFRHVLTYGIPQNACFLEQLAARSVRKTFSGLQRAARCRPTASAGEGAVLEPESAQQHPIASVNYE